MELKRIGIAAMICSMLIGGGIVSAQEDDDHGHANGRSHCREGHIDRVHHSDTYVKDTAKEKGITLIDESKVKSIVAQSVGITEKDLQFARIGLLNATRDSNEFKPVYGVMCFANGIGYHVRVNAISGEVIKELPQRPIRN